MKNRRATTPGPPNTRETTVKLTFLGAAGTVTGSKYLLETDKSRILVDCGLYQGIKNLRLRNWAPMPVDPKTIDAVVLTHAHIDHSGYLPALINHGFRGKVWCTRPTKALCEVLLPDAGFLQEEDARYANLKKFSKHEPAKPLYTEQDGKEALKHFTTINCDQPTRITADITLQFTAAGHILGASSAHISDGHKSVLFSGDIGRQNDDIMYAPAPCPAADYVVVESTYGDTLHPPVDAKQELADIITETAGRGGIVLMPAFAVGRAQSLLYLLSQIRDENLAPSLPVFLNSPMAITATELFCHFHKEHKLTPEQCRRLDDMTTYVRSAEESMELNKRKFPSIIISASGMASGGRVLHHLKSLLPNERNSVVFAGYQAPGTRGDALVRGAAEVKIHGAYIPVRAEVYNIESLSAHADAGELMTWLDALPKAPQQVFVTHGELAAADALRVSIQDQFKWQATVPEYRDSVLL